MELIFLAFQNYFGRQFVKLMRQLTTSGFQCIPLEECKWWIIGQVKDRHGFATNLGTALAIDGFVIEIRKPTA
jgi:hypothetical protein